MTFITAMNTAVVVYIFTTKYLLKTYERRCVPCNDPRSLCKTKLDPGYHLFLKRPIPTMSVPRKLTLKKWFGYQWCKICVAPNYMIPDKTIKSYVLWFYLQAAAYPTAQAYRTAVTPTATQPLPSYATSYRYSPY